MKLTDILALTKAGYTIAEIKGMENRDAVVQIVSQGVARDDVADYLELMQDESAPEQAAEENEPDAPDYKSLYEAEVAKNQKKETQKPADPSQSNPKTAEEILAEILAE